ncbi:VCBS repeat-containing protein [Ruficoccus amylovorans]|uniref:VCBS repeat-containing protein n=2 Tax=Ruficoccus amylovorans TaxID=1804625 RepID=A0A842HFR2_9BACT|nr:VCBS repeat-containing protein [Ruficoccus amylovorans]
MPEADSPLQRLPYNAEEGQLADLGVGLWGWPFPYDVNGNGLTDLVLVSGASPYRGTYFFENTGKKDPQTGADVFKKAVYIGPGRNDITPSYMPDGSMRVLGAGVEYPDFLKSGTKKSQKLDIGIDEKDIHQTSGRVRGKQWSYVDYDKNGVMDLIVGVGDWTDYGWDNAYDENGRWTNGPLHGYVYLLRNEGTNDKPSYAAPERLMVDDVPLDVYGMPSPVFADFLQDGKQHLICGEFVDGLTFFENIGTADQPKFARGKRLRYQGELITLPLCMIVVVGYDWNGNGLTDLVVAQEDGLVAVLENTGNIVDGMPEFLPPRMLRQQADEVMFGVLTTPSLVDFDDDGREDIITGNAAGEIGFIKNLGGDPTRWAEPVLLESEGEPIRFIAGPNGSIQGPAEYKWGYTNLSTGDWDGDGKPDIMVSTITGNIYWFKNLGNGPDGLPRLSEAMPVRVNWGDTPPQKPAWNWWDPEDDELVVQWRCTPLIVHLPGEERPSLVTVDTEGYLALYRQSVDEDGNIRVLPGERVFKMRGLSSFDSKHKPTGEENGLLRLNDGEAGRSGRRTYIMTDWDGDGKLDLLVNSVNVNFLKNVSETEGEWVFEDQGPISTRRLAGHSTTPGMGDWNGDGKQQLMIGAEDGFFYYFPDPADQRP